MEPSVRVRISIGTHGFDIIEIFMPRRNKQNMLSLVSLGFFAVVALLLLEANVVVYSAIISVFQSTSYERFSLCILLALLSGGFVVMLSVEKFYTNKMINFFYRSTSAWIGIFVYLFISSIVYIILSFFFNIPLFVGALLFLFAILVSIYGIIHGQKIVVKKIQISLPALPSTWKGKTLVWMSDVHLNSTRGVKFAEKIKNITNSLSPDIVFIGGDLFDGSHKPDPYMIAEPLKNLFSRLGVFYITGNHEEFGDPDIFLKAVESLGFKILRDEMIEIEGVQIIGVDYLNNVTKEQFQKTLESLKIDKSKLSILLKHEPKDLDISEKAGISFQISGHTHRGQQWPFNYLTYLVYKGYGYGLKKYHSMLIYVSSGVGGWGPKLRIGSDDEIVQITLL